jgi:hypothetical protein
VAPIADGLEGPATKRLDLNERPAYKELQTAKSVPSVAGTSLGQLQEDGMNKHIIGLVALAAGVAIAALSGVGLASGSAVPALSAKLNASGEVPKSSSHGSGTAVIKLDAKTGQVCWTLSVTGLDRATAAHIHKAPAGKAGPVIVPLGFKAANKGCVISAKKFVSDILANPGGYYVNVYTKKYPNGAIAGRLHS